MALILKSKLASTTLRNVLCVLVLLNFNFIESFPTFGDEFVHIKVHLPKEEEVHGPPVNIHPHPIVHAPVHSAPKVIHHFHHRKRRPAKKNPFAKHAGLLESILLTEVKKPINSDHYKYLNHAEDIAKNIDSFIVKPEKPKTHIDTYKVIEETKPIKETTETYKVIETKVPQHQSHHFDSHSEGGYSYKPKGHTETYKVIDGLFDDYHSHFKDTEHSYLPPKKQRVKTVKIIESPLSGYEQDHSHYGYHYQGHDLEHDFTTHEDHPADGGYHYETKSHADIVKIVETQAPHQHEYGINFGKRPHSDIVEIVKSHGPSKPSSYYNRQQHHHRPNYDDHHYHDEASSSAGGIGHSHEETYSTGYDYRPHKHHDSYRTIPDEHYTHEPEDSYLPPKRTPQYHSSVRQNSLYDDEPESVDGDAVAAPQDSYLPPPLPQTLPGLQHSSGSVASQWPNYDSSYKATETYTGIDSYSAPHVQGVGSNGYQYPSPYP